MKKFYLVILLAILLSTLALQLACEKTPTGPVIIPDEEIAKIPFERLNGKIAFRRIIRNLPDEYYLIILDAEERTLTNKALFYPYTPANFQFSPDGDQILFSYYLYQSATFNFQWQVYIVDLNTLSLTNFSPSYFNDSFGAWSPDGEKIAFWSTRNYVSGIWMQEIDADSAQFLTEVHVLARTRPAWSVDSQELYLSSMDEIGRAILMKMNLQTNNIDTLIFSAEDSNEVAYKHLAMSPDGEKLAFVKAQMTGIDEIWVLNLVENSLAQLTTGAADWHPCWDPDGTQILFSRGSNLYIMNEDGSDIEQVTFGEKNFDEYPTWIKKN